MKALFWISVGLIIGWNALPQPAFVKAAYDKALAKIKELIGG